MKEANVGKKRSKPAEFPNTNPTCSEQKGGGRCKGKQGLKETF